MTRHRGGRDDQGGEMDQVHSETTRMHRVETITKGSTLRRQPVDVLVIGGGNAALCAALEAAHGGARVLLLEASPEHFRAATAATPATSATCTRGATATSPARTRKTSSGTICCASPRRDDRALARLTIRASEDLDDWIERHGVRWQPPLQGTLHLARTNLFMLGGGKAMMNAYYATASARGRVAYDATVCRSEDPRRRCSSPQSSSMTGATHEVTGEASSWSRPVASRRTSTWLKEYWGDAADNFIIRGTPYNQGKMLRRAARPRGASRSATRASSTRSPSTRARRSSMAASSPGSTACRSASPSTATRERFYDEGEDFWPKRYAIWGGLIARQPDQIAYSIIDAKVMGEFMPSVFPPSRRHRSPSSRRSSELDPARWSDGRASSTARCGRARSIPANLDDCHTEGLDPPKSHWALPIDTPPFYGYPLRPGITFTYLGVDVDECARVICRTTARSRTSSPPAR